MHVHRNRCTHRSLRAAAHAALIAVATSASACVYIDDVFVYVSDSSVPDPGDEGDSGAPCSGGDETTCGADDPDLPGDTGEPGETGAVPTGGMEPGETGEAETGGVETEGAETGMEATGEPPPIVVCGDGMIGGDEVCDDGVNDGAYGGCMSGCTAQGPFCGDGEVDFDHEACDAGGAADDPSCTTTCKRVRCGDGVLQAGEECEAGVVMEASCESLGLASGPLGCEASTCAFDVSMCVGCGNGEIGADEVCDGAALGDASCESLGFAGGALACDATCGALDTSACLVDLPVPTGCCVAGDPGACTVDTVETCVCDQAPECCDLAWDDVCVMIAIKACFATCP